MMRTSILVLVFVCHAWAQAPSLRERMLAAEDARVTTDTAMAPLLQGLRAVDPKLVVQAVRGLGRFERPELVKHIIPLATHVRPEVRGEAINALGQALAAIPRASDRTDPLPPEVATVTKVLLARLRSEGDPYVVGIVAETLGRLPFRTAAALTQAEDALVSLLPVGEGSSPERVEGEPLGRVMHPASATGAVKGLETRIRVYQKLAPVAPRVVARLRSAATFGSDPSDGDLAFIRRVAWLALNGARATDLALMERGLEDPDAQVRRLVIVSLGNVEAAAADRLRLLKRGLSDQSPIVRYDAVRVYSRTLQASDCAPIVTAIDDRSVHVALAAIDALGDGCPGGPNAVKRLLALADSIPTAGQEWHRGAHAFVSLAKVSRPDATGRLSRFAEHPTWQVRMYAARAAAALAAAGRLERLAQDQHDNVREAAVTGLMSVRGHDSDAVYIDALARRDYQLVLTAANALKGSPNGARALPALLAAFARITAERRDTSRDPRVAILDRVREFGGRPQAAALQSCLADFDPMVAGHCAATLQGWTGTPHTARPARPATAPVVAPASPPATPVARRARITMRGKGAFELRLFSDEAPATIARFVRLARHGTYNGLTFHRVVPNFVIQGGSPGANEYMGDGPFMRDEVGLRSHARGTLGISTRGRDTGDAQIFVNVADNPRLDHNYTVFAEVTTGMDVVDGILEGDVIERVDVLDPVSSQSRQ